MYVVLLNHFVKLSRPYIAESGGLFMQDRFRAYVLVAPLIFAVFVVAGCSARLHLYPVSGPVAAQTPPPVFPARISVNYATRSGSFSTILSDGESFRGRWTLVAPGPANPSAADDLSATWDLVYGSGFYLAHVLGNRECGSSTVTGNRGTKLNVQICGQEKAVAKDSKGNIYKLTLG